MNGTLQRVLAGNADNHILPFFWQHGEDEQRLQDAYRAVDQMARTLEEGEAGVYKVEHYAHHHGDG